MRKAQNYQWKEMSLGTCYYPEHWDRKLWREDLDRMLANGIHTIRIGEFAWSKVEPREGEFTFAFFDDFLEVVAQTETRAVTAGQGVCKLPLEVHTASLSGFTGNTV